MRARDAWTRPVFKLASPVIELVALVFLLLLTSCASQPQIGAIIQPKVGEFGSTGTCIGNLRTREPCAYSISVFEQNSIPRMVALLAFVARDEGGHPQWRIADKVALPGDMSNKFVRYDACRNNENPDDPAVAVVNNYDRAAGEFIKAAGWAYTVDVASGKFVKINAGGVDCLAQVGED